MELVAKRTASLAFSSKQNELSIKFKKSVLSCSGSIACARVPASSCCLSCMKFLVARVFYDILCLKYGPDCPLKHRLFSYFTILTKRLKITIQNKLRTESLANLHLKLKLGIRPSLSIWQIHDRFLHLELLLHASNWNSWFSVSISESIFTFQIQTLIFSFIWRHITALKLPLANNSDLQFKQLFGLFILFWCFI